MIWYLQRLFQEKILRWGFENFYRVGFENFTLRGTKILAFNIFWGYADCQLGGRGPKKMSAQCKLGEGRVPFLGCGHVEGWAFIAPGE